METAAATKDINIYTFDPEILVKVGQVYDKLSLLTDFDNHKPEVLAMVAKFMKTFRVDPKLWDDNFSGKVRQWMLIGLADEYKTLSDDKHSVFQRHSKRLCFERIKLLCMLNGADFSDNITSMTHFSEVHRRKDDRISIIKESSFQGTEEQGLITLLNTIQTQCIDQQATTQLITRLNTDTHDNPLRNIRNRMNLHIHDEKTFTVIVLNLSALELSEQTKSIGFQCIGYCFEHENVPCIVLPSDWESNSGSISLLEHEYFHTQDDELTRGRFGYKQLFGAAILEAKTEEATTNPSAYYSQRQVWKYILKKIPELDALSKALTHEWTVEDFERYHLLILQRFGIHNWIGIMTLHPGYTAHLPANTLFYTSDNNYTERLRIYGGHRAKLWRNTVAHSMQINNSNITNIHF
jgi:hypothetical protein